MDNMELYGKMRSVPQEARKQIAGGRLKGFTDINPMWRIKKLTEVFGPCGFGWYSDEVERWTESSNGVMGVFVKIHLYVKMNDEWSRPIVGIGGSSLVAQEKSGLVFSDEAFKMAYTDAISVACKALVRRLAAAGEVPEAAEGVPCEEEAGARLRGVGQGRGEGRQRRGGPDGEAALLVCLGRADGGRLLGGRIQLQPGIQGQ